MNEEQNQLDADLKELFMDSKFDEMKEILGKQTDETIRLLSDHGFGIVKRYYDNENFKLLFQHFKFVAYSCFMVEYAHSQHLINNDAFGLMLSVYNDIYEMKKKQNI